MRKGKSFVCGNLRGWTREEQALVRVVDELYFDDDGQTAKIKSIRRYWTTDSLAEMDRGGISVFKEEHSFQPMLHIRLEHLEHKNWELLQALSSADEQSDGWEYPDKLRRQIRAIEELLAERLEYEKSRFEQHYENGCREVKQRRDEWRRRYRLNPMGFTDIDAIKESGERAQAALEGGMRL
tara:strand:- start:810 stop:1355 length:546 start_codon:yes stop_codon:yes gene_type:complete